MEFEELMQILPKIFHNSADLLQNLKDEKIIEYKNICSYLSREYKINYTFAEKEMLINELNKFSDSFSEGDKNISINNISRSPNKSPIQLGMLDELLEYYSDLINEFKKIKYDTIELDNLKKYTIIHMNLVTPIDLYEIPYDTFLKPLVNANKIRVGYVCNWIDYSDEIPDEYKMGYTVTNPETCIPISQILIPSNLSIFSGLPSDIYREYNYLPELKQLQKNKDFIVD